MFLAQIFCRDIKKYPNNARYRFEFSRKNWYKDYPEMHTDLKFREE